MLFLVSFPVYFPPTDYHHLFLFWKGMHSTVIITDKTESSPVVLHTFITSSLLASCWLWPIIPWDLTLAKFLSEQSNIPTITPPPSGPANQMIPSVGLHSSPQWDWYRMLSLAQMKRQTVFQVKVLLSQRKAAPPVCEEGGRALSKNAETGVLLTAAVLQLSALTAHVYD